MAENTAEKRFCLECDDGTLLVHGEQDLAIEIENMETLVPAVEGWHCPVCGDCVFTNRDDSARYSAALTALRAQVEHRRAERLRAIRRKLGLNQAEAGRLFGGGASAFSEYERGKTQPHKSTLLLFKLLDKHPELLDEIRAG